MEHNTIHIAVLTSNNYMQHTAVMLCSLFSNTVHRDFHIHLLTDVSEKTDTKKLQAFIEERWAQKVTVYSVMAADIRNFKEQAHVSRIIYLKFFLPSVLGHDVKKVLCIDSDMIVLKDIADIWKIAIDDHYLAVADDLWCDWKERIGLPATAGYFNAGLMLVNLERWRTEGVQQKALSLTKEKGHTFPCNEQDALNILFRKWIKLHPRWNMQMNYAYRRFSSDKVLQEACVDPAIIHYIGPSKPWHYTNQHRYRKEYFKYLALTPWKDFIFPDKTFQNKVKKMLLDILPVFLIKFRNRISN